MDECQHPKDTVRWELTPTYNSKTGAIEWWGKCKCGKDVYIQYISDETACAEER